MRQLSGKWIALDGTDAVGKSTQVQLLKNKIEEAGMPALVLPEFSESPLGRTITQIIQEQRFYALHTLKKTPYADTHALIADLVYKIEAEGHDILKQGGVVLSDRGILSLIGYQAKRIELHSDIAPVEAVKRLHETIQDSMKHLRLPDHHILLTIDESEMQNRVVGRGETPMTGEDLNFMKEVRIIMENLSSYIDTSRLDVTNLNIEDVTNKILLLLNTRFSSR